MIYRSPEPDIEIPDVTLTEHVIGGAAARGDHPAIIDSATGETTTYAELAAKVDAVAALPPGRGRSARATWSLWSGPNSAEWAIAYHAILRAGGVVTPMNPLLTPEERGKQEGNAGSSAADRGPARARRQGRARRDAARRSRSIPSELAVLPYSSGTTGLMKGVMLTHRNLVANIEQAWNSMPLDHEDTLVGAASVLPQLRADGGPQHGPGEGLDDRHHAPLRPRRACSRSSSGTGSPGSTSCRRWCSRSRPPRRSTAATPPR